MRRENAISTPQGPAVLIPHSGWSNSVPTLNRFAERMVEHGDIERAAAECGITLDYGRMLRSKLRGLWMEL